MRHALLLPFRPAPLILVVLFAIGSRLALFAGVIGIGLAALLEFWLLKYCFVLLDAAVSGEGEPPVLSIEMLSPASEPRPLAALAIIALAYVLASLAGRIAGKPGLLVTGAALLAALPASFAVLGVTGNPLQAAWPAAIVRLIAGLGRHYAWLATATIAIGAGGYALLRSDAPLLLTLSAAELAALFVFALIGGTVHHCRLELGLATRTTAERCAERKLEEHVSARKRMLDESFAQLRLGKPAEAWGRIERWIAAHCCGERAAAEYDALLESILKWSPPGVGDRLVSVYLARLLAERDNGRALEVLERRLATHPGYRLASEDQARRLRELAALAGKRALCRQLDEPRRA
ncbi:MAG: hypothetical protein ACREU3_03460 [Steroidobacteraceae bacterium]